MGSTERLQVGATGERVGNADTGQKWYVDALQRSTMIESKTAYMIHAVGHIDSCKIIATFKGITTYIFEPIREHQDRSRLLSYDYSRLLR